MKPFELCSLAFFTRELEEVCGRFPLSARDIRAVIDTLPSHPDAGDVYPGLKTLIPARKLRIALKAYKIGRSGGLRLIYATHEEKRRVLPLHLYKKGGHGGEKEVRAQIQKRLKLALAELEAQVGEEPKA